MVFLAGCASLTGNAFYKYEKKADGTCTVTIDSGRNVTGPIGASVTDCDVEVTASDLKQGAAQTEILNNVIVAALPAILELLKNQPKEVEKKDDADGSDQPD